MLPLYYFLMTLFMIVGVFMILLVLIQKGRGGGMAGAFGGGGGNTAFGSKTGDVLTWATSIVFGVFLLVAICLNLVANKVGASTRTAAADQTQTPLSAPVGSTNIPAAPSTQP